MLAPADCTRLITYLADAFLCRALHRTQPCMVQGHVRSTPEAGHRFISLMKRLQLPSLMAGQQPVLGPNLAVMAGHLQGMAFGRHLLAR